MSITDRKVLNYINEIQPLFNGVLGDIQRSALAKNIPIIPPETARFLVTLLSIHKPKNILEIGCAIGFSSGLMCSCLPDDGHITTIDRFDVMIKQAKENFRLLDIENKVTLLEGDACGILPTLEEKYDFIFLDAAKGQYLQMFPDCIRLLNIGGVFLADDVMQEGRIASERQDIPRRQRTIQKRMKSFLYLATNTVGLETSILPVGDGLLLAVKTEEIKEIKYSESY